MELETLTWNLVRPSFYRLIHFYILYPSQLTIFTLRSCSFTLPTWPLTLAHHPKLSFKHSWTETGLERACIGRRLRRQITPHKFVALEPLQLV